MKSEQISKELADFIYKNPALSRKQIRLLMPKQYFWLYKHNKTLLNEILPAPKLPDRSKPKKSRVDWEKRDGELYEKVVEAIKKIKLSEKPIFITKNSIAKETGYSFQNVLNKLPKVKALVDQNIESKEEFQLRRVDYVVKKLISEEYKINKDIIVKKAGLLPYRPIKAYEYVDEVLKKYREGLLYFDT
jgi:hypothetical protein